MTTIGTSFATLPDPSEPTIIAFGMAVGAFVAETLARLTRTPAERRTEALWDGGYVGTAVAIVVFSIANALEVVS